MSDKTLSEIRFFPQEKSEIIEKKMIFHPNSNWWIRIIYATSKITFHCSCGRLKTEIQYIHTR